MFAPLFLHAALGEALCLHDDLSEEINLSNNLNEQKPREILLKGKCVFWPCSDWIQLHFGFR